jgi:hypothetical protein
MGVLPVAEGKGRALSPDGRTLTVSFRLYCRRGRRADLITRSNAHQTEHLHQEGLLSLGGGGARHNAALRMAIAHLPL